MGWCLVAVDFQTRLCVFGRLDADRYQVPTIIVFGSSHRQQAPAPRLPRRSDEAGWAWQTRPPVPHSTTTMERGRCTSGAALKRPGIVDGECRDVVGPGRFCGVKVKSSL